jgi:hypothetical protein
MLDALIFIQDPCIRSDLLYGDKSVRDRKRVRIEVEKNGRCRWRHVRRDVDAREIRPRRRKRKTERTGSVTARE